WKAPIWFVGIEEAGGATDQEVAQRLNVWNSRGRHELEDCGSFCHAIGNYRWHDARPTPQPTWAQLIRMLLLARGKSDCADALLDYQRTRLGNYDGEVCLLELFPLPNPSFTSWRYAGWSKLPWLQTREQYTSHVLSNRIALLVKRIKEYKPKAVIFYGDG